MPKIALVRHSSLPVNAVVSTVYDGLPNTNAVISVIIKIQNSGRKWLEKTAQVEQHRAIVFIFSAKATPKGDN